MKLKNKILAGILSGALIFSGGFFDNPAQAQPNPNEMPKFDWHHGNHERHQMTEEKINEHSKRIAERCGVDQSEIAAALKNHVHFGDIMHAATLAKISGKSFSEILEMKTDWRQVAEKIGVTREQIDEFMKSEMIGKLAQDSKLDAKTVESLLAENYNPHDITVAGIIANAAGKNVKNVITKRKINNRWDDVAKEFNVDLHKILKDNRPHHERGEHRK